MCSHRIKNVRIRDEQIGIGTNKDPESGVRSTKSGHLINGVESSLRMRVISVPQAINSQRQLIWRKVETRFHPRNMVRDDYGGSGFVSSGEALC
ncbi:hypothetical protein TNCV_1923861 [Trichonephila clavipes]|nr:hypothetical protein TNCV_1923861 [Trichonephila clavipes]